MVYESSYESGRIPFLPDTKRGSWSNPDDFLYAGIGLAFRLDIFLMYFLSDTSVFTFIPVYLLSMALYIVPFIVIQSFMGQFSSSGFISAFRLSPIFKGIGYVSLISNMCVITYYSVFAMVPLVYMFASMKPTLPWSCEGFKQWAYNITEEEEINLCNLKIPNTTHETTTTSSNHLDNSTEASYYDYLNHHIPSVLYFKNLFHDLDLFGYNDVEFSMSWQLILCAILVWTIISIVFYKCFNTEKFGLIIRYSVWTLVGLLILFIIRFSFLPGAGKISRRGHVPTWHEVLQSIPAVPICGLSSYGPGWGLFITLSSFNKFKTNIIKCSWLIGFGQLFILLGLDLLVHFSEQYFGELTGDNYYSMLEQHWILYLSSGSVMAHMGWANLWSILFYFMLFLAGMLLLIIQLYSILTTLFDEFVSLRERKFEVCMSIIGIMAAISLYFTSNHGITYFTALTVDIYITQITINLLLLLIVLWIYGRVRFQRDMEFMINENFSTWNINMLRFVSPLGMLLALLISVQYLFWEHELSSFMIDIYAIIAILIPWLCIPGYAAYCMLQTMGPIKSRFARCCRPTDWYPVEAEYRQQYEQAMGNTDITQTLSEVKEDEIFGIAEAHYEHTISSRIIDVSAVIFIVLPWLCIPGYAAYLISKSRGSLENRFQRCCRPTDWYPAERHHRHNYEETVNNMDLTHQLNEITEYIF